MFPTAKVHAPEFKKHGFHRTPADDFSDDGTRFMTYEYKGLTLSYAYDDEYGHFAALRFDYTPDLDYKTYSLFPSYKLADEFNGSKTLDPEKLAQNAEAMVADINRWVENPNFAREAEQKKIDDFRKACEWDHMSDIEDQKARDAVWNLAWEYGHSSGLEEVRSYYIDLAGLAYACMYR